MAKILFFDIECTSLDADFGYVMCFGYKWLGEKRSHVISIDDFPQFHSNPTDDKQLVRAAAKILSQADIWVTWYGAGFDVPFLNSRLLVHGLDVLPPVPHVDGWRIAKERLKLHSNRLASVSAFLGLEEKTRLSGPIWVRAAAGHKPSLRYVIDHCVRDVSVLEGAYEKIKKLSMSHPNVALVEGQVGRMGCPVCGEHALQRRGEMVTAKRRYTRYQCQSCAAWTKEPERVVAGKARKGRR